MSKNQRIALIAGGGLVLVFLLYRYVKGNAGANTAATTSAAPDSSQYAALAGQEQSDVAGLQAQEQSDIQNLLGANTDLAQTLGDAQSKYQQTLTDAQSTFETNLGGMVGAGLAQQNQSIAKVASGQTQINRVLSAITRLDPNAQLVSTTPQGKKPKAGKGETVKGIGGGFWEKLRVPVTNNRQQHRADVHTGGATTPGKSRGKK